MKTFLEVQNTPSKADKVEAPMMRCTLPSGKRGWKWGSSGHCYAQKSDANEQRKAIKSK